MAVPMSNIFNMAFTKSIDSSLNDLDEKCRLLLHETMALTASTILISLLTCYGFYHAVDLMGQKDQGDLMIMLFFSCSIGALMVVNIAKRISENLNLLKIKPLKYKVILRDHHDSRYAREFCASFGDHTWKQFNFIANVYHPQKEQIVFTFRRECDAVAFKLF